VSSLWLWYRCSLVNKC